MKKAGPDIWRIRIGLPLRALDGFATALEELTEACSWFLQDPAGNEEAPDELWWLDGFSRAVPDRSAIHSALALAAASMDLPAPEILIDSIADTDWVSANLRDFPPIRAGRFLVHGSHYQGGKPGGSLTLQIDAGTAFGSGEHATTFGCLTAIDRLLRRRRFHHPLDLGCGSGILAIALAKTCKRAYVLAADIDPEAVRVAAANARLNQAAAKLTARVADGYRRRAVTRRRPYDLVVANILARPLVAMAAGLGRHLTKDGIAILSGLLVSQERLVLAAHRLQGLSLAARIRVNGWSTLVLTRSPRSLSFIGTKPCKPTAEPGPLARLREALAQRQLDGFIVPHNDEYQGEYLPPSAERLAWLTGFSGSAGLAIIFARKAALFVDGRYTLQARQQVDETQFLLLHQQDQPPAQWLETALNPGLRLGYDPWLHTPDGIEPLAKACAKAGAELVPVGDNPLDGVWEDRPLPPMARVTPHALAYAGRSREDKQGQLAKDLAEAAVDAVMLTAPDSIAWLLNLRGGDVPFSPLPLCFAMAHRDGSLDLFIDPGKCGPDLDGHLGPAVRRRTPSEMGPMLDRMAGKRVRLDPASAPVWIFERLSAAKASVERGPDPCLLPKACKTPWNWQAPGRPITRMALLWFASWPGWRKRRPMA